MDGDEQFEFEQQKKEVHQTLKSLRSSGRLQRSRWLGSSLVEDYCAKRPGTTDHQALKKVYSEILRQLSLDWPDQAKLLHERFWEGHNVASTVSEELPGRGSKSAVEKGQAEAIDNFTRLLLAEERTCYQQRLSGSPGYSWNPTGESIETVQASRPTVAGQQGQTGIAATELLAGEPAETVPMPQLNVIERQGQTGIAATVLPAGESVVVGTVIDSRSLRARQWLFSTLVATALASMVLFFVFAPLFFLLFLFVSLLFLFVFVLVFLLFDRPWMVIIFRRILLG